MKIGHAVADVLSKLNTFLNVDLDHCDTADTMNTRLILNLTFQATNLYLDHVGCGRVIHTSRRG